MPGSAPRRQVVVAREERPRRLVGRPGAEPEAERLDALQLGPVPRLGAERAALCGEQRAIRALDLHHVGLDGEVVAQGALEVVLGLLERGAERAAVLERV